MGRSSKSTEPTLEGLSDRIFQLEKLCFENLTKLEKDLDQKYTDVAEKVFKTYTEFAQAFSKTHDAEAAKLENQLNDWIGKEGEKADAHRAKQDLIFEANQKHMKVVEQYVHVQNEILKANTQILCDIRDCLKTLSLSKMRTRKNAYHGTDN